MSYPPHRVGTDEQSEEPPCAECPEAAGEASVDLGNHVRDAAEVRNDAPDDEHEMCTHEKKEEGQERRDRLLDSPHVEHHQDDDRRELERELEGLVRYG